LRKNRYFSHKIWKIGPWRSLRILRLFSAKVDFCRFMYCFGRFSVLKHRIWAHYRTAMSITYFGMLHYSSFTNLPGPPPAPPWKKSGSYVCPAPIMAPHYGAPFWTPIMDPHYGPTEIMIYIFRVLIK
jgi:hypothetical protein